MLIAKRTKSGRAEKTVLQKLRGGKTPSALKAFFGCCFSGVFVNLEILAPEKHPKSHEFRVRRQGPAGSYANLQVSLTARATLNE